ncbi:MAG: hypothetical protein KatS3mg023_3880 [Armatimonadota bacterium]|nr:MAG: hypothetical protein KatS3mg023_3880 [Armatimonadota bacterium]
MNTDGMQRELDLTGIVGVDIRKGRGNLRPGLPSIMGVPNTNRYPGVLTDKPEQIDFQTITKAYLRDSYLSRSINRYVSICFTREPEIEASESVADYLQRRLIISAYLNEMSLRQWFRVVFRDFTLYGNAFLIKSRTTQLSRVGQYEIRGQRGVIAGLFPVPPETMRPIMDDTGTRVSKWLYTSTTTGRRVQREFPAEDVCHLRYNPMPSSIWGLPFIFSTIEDIRCLRKLEESILLLIDKFANPLIHVETPDLTGTGDGIIEDMQVIANAIRSMSRDGVLITAPGQKVNVIGAESIALRMEGYLDAFKRRVFSGLGMNESMIGDRSMEQKDVELDRILRDQAMDLQLQFASQVEQKVLEDLLMEAGIAESVRLCFGDPDPLYYAKHAQAVSNLYIANMITEDEAREMVGLDSMENRDYKRTYVFRAKVPLIQEQAKARASMSGLSTGDSDQPSPDSKLPKSRLSDKTAREPRPRKRD